MNESNVERIDNMYRRLSKCEIFLVPIILWVPPVVGGWC